MPSGILGNGQLGTTLIFTLGNVIRIGQLVFQILYRNPVAEEQVYTSAISVSTGSQKYTPRSSICFFQNQAAIVFII